MRQFGIREFVVSSTGNTSTSVAWMARYYPDMVVHIFIGREFVSRLRHLASSNVVVHVVDGTFVAAGEAGKRFASSRGLHWEAGFFNPSRRDGLKTAFIEAAREIGTAPMVYVQAVSSAMGVVGTIKGAGELGYFGLEPVAPRPICVQQESCAPMVRAWEERSESILPHHKVAEPTGLAKAILRGDPSGSYPIVRRLVLEHGGTFLSVSEAEIRAAQVVLWEEERIWACEAAACAFAGYVKAVGEGVLDDVGGAALVNLTGGSQRRSRWMR